MSATAPELADMRRWLHSLLKVPNGGVVVDIGCGDGSDLLQLASERPQAGVLVGVDRTTPARDEPGANQITGQAATSAFMSPSPLPSVGEVGELANRERGKDHSRKSPILRPQSPSVHFVKANANLGLPFRDASIDALYPVNFLECLPNRPAFIAECARVLRPGGSIMVAHYDWDTQTFDGAERALVRKIVHAFNDWKQAWMEDIDPWCGRRLWPLFQEHGGFEGSIQVHTLISTCFEPGSYGRDQVESFQALVRLGLIGQEEYDEFIAFLQQSAEPGGFFYSVTMFAFVGIRKVPS